MDVDQVMTVEDLAKYLRAHRSTVYRHLKKGDLRGFRVGADWRFRKVDIDAWIERQVNDHPLERQMNESTAE